MVLIYTNIDFFTLSITAIVRIIQNYLFIFINYYFPKKQYSEENYYYYFFNLFFEYLVLYYILY